MGIVSEPWGQRKGFSGICAREGGGKAVKAPGVSEEAAATRGGHSLPTLRWGQGWVFCRNPMCPGGYFGAGVHAQDGEPPQVD